MRKSKHDNINDEKKPFTIREWAEELKNCIDDFVDNFDSEGSSEWMKTSHTFDEWTGTFLRWMSF